MNNNFFQRIILPGLIFQSTMIGGGYATGRELIEFFLQLGPKSALLAMLISTVLFSVVSIVAFEFSRTFKAYNYKAFFRRLLGPGWFVFEIAYISLIILILSVLGAASGELIHSSLNIAPTYGTFILMVSIGVLVFYGSKIIETVLSVWSILLYISYITLIIWSMYIFGDTITGNIKNDVQVSMSLNTVHGGLSYAGYNVVVFTAVLFVVRHFKSRSDSIWAGLLCGPLAMIPGLLLLLAMLAHYPEIIDKSLPISHLLTGLNAPSFLLFFQIVIFGTFIETGTALLHSVNERVAGIYDDKHLTMPKYLRPAVAITLLFVAIFLATEFGIVALIGQGYAYSSYFFLLIVTLPLLTRGIWLIKQHQLKRFS